MTAAMAAAAARANDHDQLSARKVLTATASTMATPSATAATSSSELWSRWPPRGEPRTGAYRLGSGRWVSPARPLSPAGD